MAHPDIPGLTGWHPLARGGFATVWEARQETLDRPVAVKIDQRTLDDPKERRRFLREANAAGKMSGHRGIVTVHDAGILADGRPYIVMALCPKGSLTTWLKQDPRPTDEQVRDVGVRIADALAAAHSMGVLHRDVKPANIMIDAYGEPGLADFGLAAMPQPGQDVSVTMEALTPAYAPKEVLYQKPPSEYGDVFSLAATLYALLGGRPPRWPDSGTPSLPEIFELQGQPIERLPGVHPQLMDVVMNALADEAGDRPSAAEFRDQLEAIDFAAPQEPPPPPPPAQPQRPAPRPEGARNKGRIAILVAAVAALIVGAIAVGMALAGGRPPVAGPTPVVTESPSSTASESPTPSPSPTPTGLPVPDGFADCSQYLGPNTYCPVEPQCWYQYISNNDFPAVANPIACTQSHTHQTFAAGRVSARPRLQSQLEGNRTVQQLCNRASAAKVVLGERVESDWTIDVLAPMDGPDERIFLCLAVTGESRSTAFKVRS